MQLRHIAIAAAGVLVAAEIGARLSGFGHPLIYRGVDGGYEWIAGQSSKMMGHVVHINMLGTRGPETAVQPKLGTRRILSIGDSVAWGGTDTPDGGTYPAIVGQNLNAEVLNASAPGWAVQNEAQWLKKHGTLSANDVVLEVNEKDLDQVIAPTSTLDASAPFPSRPPISALAYALNRWVFPKIGLARPAVDPGAGDTGVNITAEVAALAAVAEIYSLSRAANARLTILYWDAHYTFPPAPQTVAARERLFAWAYTNHIHVVRPNIAARPDWRAFFKDSIHPNRAANRIIADQLSERLRH